MIGALATYLFSGGHTLKLVKNSVNVTNLTNPLILTKNITLVFFDCFAPPPVRLAFHCLGVVATIGAATAASNPVTIGSAIHLVTELCEQC